MKPLFPIVHEVDLLAWKGGSQLPAFLLTAHSCCNDAALLHCHDAATTDHAH